MKRFILPAICLMAAFSACTNNDLDRSDAVRTVLSVKLPAQTKTVLGDENEGVRPVLWCKGDRISVNGTVSNPLGIEGTAATADFEFSGEISAPYSAIYPAEMVKSGSVITLPSLQSVAKGDNIVSGTLPMAAYSEDESITMGQLCGILGIRLKGGSNEDVVRYIEVTAPGGEALCGDFTVNFSDCSLSSSGSGANALRLEIQGALSLTEASAFNVIIPAGVYSEGFSVKIVDESGHSMTRTLGGSRTLAAGKLMLLPELTFEADGEEKGVEIATPEQWNSFAAAYNAGEYPESQIATLTADLDFGSIEADDFVSLGLRENTKQFPSDATESKYFNGTLLGNGMKIMNLKTDVPLVQGIGTEALIDGVTLDSSCSFTVWYDGSKVLEFGSLIGYCSGGKVKNCTSLASVTLSQYNSISNAAALYVGGLVGRNRAAAISDCSNSCTITADKTYITDSASASSSNLYIGGLIGYCSNQNGTVKNCTNAGSISVSSTALYITVGGLCARASAGSFSQCVNTGDITLSTVRASGDPCKFFYTGGLLGLVDTNDDNSLSLSDCINSGSITSSSNVKQQVLGGVTGIIRTTKATFTGNKNSGAITTTEALRNLYCGGLFGCIAAEQNLALTGEPFTGSINIGPTESTTSAYIYCGGLIGQTTAEVTLSGDNLTSRAGVTFDISSAENTAAESYIGGIVGCAYGAPISISGVKSEGSVTIKTGSFAMSHIVCGVGGILGGATLGAALSDCSNSASVQMSSSTIKSNGKSVHFGGIAGRLSGGAVQLRRCTNSGILANRHYNNNIWSGYSGDATGGIAGSICYASGNTFAATIEDCHNTGTVYAYRGMAGGIAGYISKAEVTDCDCTDNVTRAAPGGGIAGVCESCTISSCDVKCDIEGQSGGSAIGYAGGIVGESRASFLDGCRYYGAVTGVTSVGGIIGQGDAGSSVGATSACSFGGTVAGTEVTAENLSTTAVGNSLGTIKSLALWNGVL